MPFSPATLASTGETSNSQRKTRDPIYSFNWAATIVSKQRGSHVRAWELFDGILGLSERQLAFLVACNDPAWPEIREISHRISKWAERCATLAAEGPGNYLTAAALLVALPEILKKSPKSPFLDYLTARIRRLMLMEQVKKGEERFYRSSGLFAEGESGQAEKQAERSQEAAERNPEEKGDITLTL